MYVKVQVIKASIVSKGERLLIMKVVQKDKPSWCVRTANFYLKPQGIYIRIFFNRYDFFLRRHPWPTTLGPPWLGLLAMLLGGGVGGRTFCLPVSCENSKFRREQWGLGEAALSERG